MLVGFLYSVCVCVIWGGLAVFLKYSTTFADPFTTCVFRFGIASVLTCIGLAAFQRKSLNFKAMNRYTALGSVFLAVNYVGFMLGIKYTTATNAQLMIQSSSFLAFIFGVIFLKEKITKSQSFGLIACIAGFFVFYISQTTPENNQNLILGDAWTLLAATCWAFYAICQKKAVSINPEASSWQLNLYLFSIAGLLLLPFAPKEEMLNIIMTPASFAFFAILGVVTLVVYFLISQSLKRITTGQMACVIPLSPFLTIVFLKILNALDLSPVPSESLPPLGYLGMLFVGFGIALIYIPIPQLKKLLPKFT